MKQSAFLRFITVLLFLLLSTAMIGQQRIHLSNPSFEGPPSCCFPPRGWVDCSQLKKSGPDVQPGWFGVNLKSQDGHSYLGMAVCQCYAWESICQVLPERLIAKQCYSFSIYLARSPKYLSRIANLKGTDFDQLYNFTTPAILQIWAAYGPCEQKELLAASEPITNADWTKYEFTFIPQNDYQYIVLTAYYSSQDDAPYNGHILLDNASAIEEINCD